MSPWWGHSRVTGVLGFPRTDESATFDRIGRYNHFAGGSIFWSPATGAHEVHAAIRDRYAAKGWERSRLGYPTSDEYGVPVGRHSDFRHGTIFWNVRNRTIFVTYR
jgi:uncharacterized protein with LGFP repeats